MYASFSIGFWYGFKLIFEGLITDISTVVVVLFSVMLMAMSMERVANPLMAMGKAMLAACEFFAVIDAPKPADGTLKHPSVNATNDIVFKDVHFAYPSRPHVKVLDGLNLVVEAGKITAIVGPSGSGKSTIVGLIQRWYKLEQQLLIAKTTEKTKKKKKKKKHNTKDGSSESDEEATSNTTDEGATGPAVDLRGSVSICGLNINDVDVKWWRSQIGVVQQEPFLFNDTIYNNVAFGLVGSEWENESEERKRQLVAEACEESFASEFIERLPDVRPLLFFFFHPPPPPPAPFPPKSG